MSQSRKSDFRALLVAQFFGALNDNLFKLVVSLLVIRQMLSGEGSIGELVLINICFVAPYILFSSYAGYFADVRAKSQMIKFAKFLEIVVMALGCFFLIEENTYALLVVLFFMGCQSALLSPAKYGILPEILEIDEISEGNGYLEFWTFVAILAGTALGGVLLSASPGGMLLPGLSVLIIALIGFGASLPIKRTPVCSEKTSVPSPLEAVYDLFEIGKNKNLFLVVLGISFFWSVGALYQLNILLFAKNHLLLSDAQTSLLIACLGVGVGIGCITAGKVSAGKVELGLVPLGAFGLSFFSAALFFTKTSVVLSALALTLVGVSVGFFIVPLNSYLQEYSPEDRRGSYIGATNFASFTGVLLFSFLLLLIVGVLKFSSAFVFLLVAIASLASAVYSCKVMPEMLLRCINWVMVRTLYRIKVVGAENIPKEGGALLVCNHVSYIDASLLMASFDRPVRYLMYRPIYEARFINPVAKALGVIPVAGEDSAKAKVKSLATAKEAIENGQIVCIFAEGALTRIGNMLPFRKGLERIVKDTGAPIIPICLDQVWGSIFSYSKGRFFWKLPKEIPYRVSVLVGKALPSTTAAFKVREAIQELSAEAHQLRSDADKVLHRAFIKTAKANKFKIALSDTAGVELSYLALLKKSILFSKVLSQLKDRSRPDGEEQMLGILLPPSAMGVISNMASLFAGFVPINLNYTASSEAQRLAVERCGIRFTISSRQMVEKLALEDENIFGELVFVEDLIPKVSARSALAVSAACLLFPRRVLQRLYVSKRREPNDLATVLFSSGSTGVPKGVMLSHSNIASNVESLFSVFQLNSEDCILGVLPLFHSLGLTGTMWLPLLSGASVAFHPNPMDATTIGEVVESRKVTIFLSTPTFLLSYIRRCKPEQFSSVRYVIVGAEKLQERVAKSFEKKFGLLPLEGYGCTELSPVAMLNVQNYQSSDGKQTGNKLGTVGHPIPGVAAKVVDPDSFEELSVGDEGLLLVKGPNVMLGYLNDPEKTKSVMRDGWYVTGDIASIDRDGFVSITDRLSRFSKIAGEMVPHVRIEEEIQAALKATEQVVVVTAVPDEKKGEKLVVLSSVVFDVPETFKKLSEQGLPNLWIPKKENVFVVEKFPILGTGKLDLKGLKSLATRLSQ
ncbi:hypothetical protein BVY02_00560 [bacterium J17]|nr:hypothetical protein BVY02_00560 [bacterium J17]